MQLVNENFLSEVQKILDQKEYPINASLDEGEEHLLLKHASGLLLSKYRIANAPYYTTACHCHCHVPAQRHQGAISQEALNLTASKYVNPYIETRRWLDLMMESENFGVKFFADLERSVLLNKVPEGVHPAPKAL